MRDGILIVLLVIALAVVGLALVSGITGDLAAKERAQTDQVRIQEQEQTARARIVESERTDRMQTFALALAAINSDLGWAPVAIVLLVVNVWLWRKFLQAPRGE